jgi:4a-hydroxytetrahydrobiopterin dehydratase
VAQLLTEDEVHTALSALPGWEGDRHGLVRTVPADPADYDEIEAAVMAAADALNHHPQVEHTGDGLRFVLWTHSAGGVTAKDVELAGHIDRALAAGGGRLDG